jgi:uncharacterized protein (DUF885 family)
MTEVFRLCDDYLTRWAALDPVAAGMIGLSGVSGAATDYGPDGFAARAELIATTLAALGVAPVTSEADQRAAGFLRERLEAQLAWHRSGEPLRLLAGELAAAAEQAHGGYRELARYLREDYAPRASERDAVGAERYAVAARISLGADIDPAEAYEWGWAELARIEAEMATEADKVSPGASPDEAAAMLDQTAYVTGADAYQAWLQDRQDEAVERLDGVLFDIAPPLRRIEAVLARNSSSGAAYYTKPSEDLTRPGRTWWPLGGRGEADRYQTWSELSTVFHEGVPGHHLQAGAAMMAGDTLSRYARSVFVSGHGEGWALYAERLADELGWFAEPGTRLGMLSGSALRAARVVIDIGFHLDLPLPDGSRWTFERACEVLRDRGRAEPHRVRPEVVRYLGWPGQAISYKLGERGWLAAREQAMRRPGPGGFDLKRWHTAALSLGPMGLDGLTEALATAGHGRG